MTILLNGITTEELNQILADEQAADDLTYEIDFDLLDSFKG